MILQRKTRHPVQFKFTEQTRRSFETRIEAKQLKADDWLFPSRSRRGANLTTRQYARRVDARVALVSLDPAAYGTHSLRRTKVSLLYAKTGNCAPVSPCWPHEAGEHGQIPGRPSGRRFGSVREPELYEAKVRNGRKADVR
jgi:hypothetical protein